jgi:hypothetical protein
MWVMYEVASDPQTRQWIASGDGAIGIMIFSGPFLVLALAAIRRRITHAAWGLLCVGLAIVAILFAEAVSNRYGSLDAGIYVVVLNSWQYAVAIVSAVVGIGLDLACRPRTSVE